MSWTLTQQNHKLHTAQLLSILIINQLLWSSGKGQAKRGKGWWKVKGLLKLKPLPRAYTKHLAPQPSPTLLHSLMRTSYKLASSWVFVLAGLVWYGQTCVMRLRRQHKMSWNTSSPVPFSRARKSKGCESCLICLLGVSMPVFACLCLSFSQ